MWTALPLRRRCASAIVSRYVKLTDGIAMGVGWCNAMGVDDIHSLKTNIFSEKTCVVGKLCYFPIYGPVIL